MGRTLKLSVSRPKGEHRSFCGDGRGEASTRETAGPSARRARVSARNARYLRPARRSGETLGAAEVVPALAGEGGSAVGAQRGGRRQTPDLALSRTARNGQSLNLDPHLHRWIYGPRRSMDLPADRPLDWTQ